MKLVIIGGHLSPALAIIDVLPKKTKVLFIGRKHIFEGDSATSLEYNIIKSLKISFLSISTGRLQRKFTKYTILSLFKIPYGFVQSFFILKNFKPDMILSFGGYLSIPVALSAFFLRIPIVIHEQTLEAGLSNRIASIFARKICISWESSRKYFPKEKTIFTGNPIRKFSLSSRPRLSDLSQQTLLKEIPRQARNDAPIIYITGGSSGSHFINTLVEGCIKELLGQFIVIHQTGDAQEYHDFDRLNKIRESLSSKFKTRYILTKFINPQDIGSVLQKANMAVGRAGINTVTELIYFNKPAMLIPIPFGQNKEQLKNALFFKNLGLGEVLVQESLSPLIFLQKIRDMVNNINRYRNRNKLAVSINKEASQNIIKILEYVKKSKQV